MHIANNTVNSVKQPHPVVSVILPAYNAQKYIRESVDSILAQTFSDFELIVVNDGSSDCTREILHSISDPRLQVVSNSKNMGLMKSLNVGISHATKNGGGTYIARQDADDISLPERFAKQVEYLQKHPDVAVVGTARKILYPDKKIREQKINLLNLTFADMLKKNCLVHGSVMIRSAVLHEVGGYNELFQLAEDYDLWLRIIRKHRIINLPEPLYILRRHTDRITCKFTHLLMLYRLLAREQALAKVSENTLVQIRDEGIESFYAHLSTKDKTHYHARLANTYQHNKRPQEALHQLTQLQKVQGFKVKTTLKMMMLRMWTK